MALEPGAKAPRLRLPDAFGGPEHAPSFERLTLLAFWKYTCPVCQMAMPYVEKFKTYAGPDFEVLTVAEDPAEPAAAFARRFGITLPIALDEAPYSASRAYRLTNVPTLILVEPDGRIGETLVSWNKEGYNALSAAVAKRLGKPPVEVSPPDDSAPLFRPG